MKNNISIIALSCIICLSLGACNHSSKGSEDKPVISVIEVEKLWCGDPFVLHMKNQLKFNTANTFTSVEQYAPGSLENNPYMPIPQRDSVRTELKNLDYSSNTIIAVTGLASAYVRTIEERFYTKDGCYCLDLYVDVADTCRMAVQWELILKAPVVMADGEKIACNITTNQPITTEEPNYVFLSVWEGAVFGAYPNPSYGRTQFYRVEGAPYVVVYDVANHQRFLDIINASSSASLLRTSPSPVWKSLWQRDAFYDDCEVERNVVFNCTYEDLIAPNIDLFKMVEPVYYVTEPFGDGTYDCWVAQMPYFLVNQGHTHKLKELAAAVGGRVVEGDNYGFFYFDRNKIHAWDMHSILTHFYDSVYPRFTGAMEVQAPPQKKYYDFEL